MGLRLPATGSPRLRTTRPTHRPAPAAGPASSTASGRITHPHWKPAGDVRISLDQENDTLSAINRTRVMTTTIERMPTILDRNEPGTVC